MRILGFAPRRPMLVAAATLSLAFLCEPLLPEARAEPAGARAAESSDPGACVKKRRKSKRRLSRKRIRRARLRRWQLQHLRELAQPKFRPSEHGQQVPDLRAGAGVIYDPAQGKILWGEYADAPRPIASITKVMTALVYFDGAPDLSQTVLIERSDVTAASKTRLRGDDEVRVEDLLHLLLLSSDNAAARALARTSTGGTTGFVARMNAKAKALGLDRARFADPSGLDERNVASPSDVAKMIVAAVEDPRIRTLMQKTSHTVRLARKTFDIHSTNRLLAAPELGVVGGKTGFINEAGYCFATVLQPAPLDRPLAVVVLGGRVRGAPFLEIRHLVSWSRKQLLPPLTGSEAIARKPAFEAPVVAASDAELERLSAEPDLEEDSSETVPGGGDRSEELDGADEADDEAEPRGAERVPLDKLPGARLAPP